VIRLHQKQQAKKRIFPEPTSCAAVAGLEKLLDTGNIKPDDTTVVAITGFGLKDGKNAAVTVS
jgi:threonine synthase